jgi:hypothetical protein
MGEGGGSGLTLVQCCNLHVSSTCIWESPKNPGAEKSVYLFLFRLHGRNGSILNIFLKERKFRASAPTRGNGLLKS